ncbi:MAG: LuxR C-terminal-related transcriptional regulator, partial [Terracoccus sp.]
DLGRLLTHLGAALDRAGMLTDPTVLDPLAAAPPIAVGAAGRAMLTSLVNSFTEGGRGPEQETTGIVVLDDYHVIESADVHEAVAFLLGHLPDGLHLVVATRSDPPLPLARLRARDQLVEVRAADLRFTAEEAQTFLNRSMGLALTASDVEALQERTEGWAAGLQLAALSLRRVQDRRDVTAFIEQLTGSHRFIIDYLADEVLARQPEQVHTFLLRTSLLDNLTGALCDAVTGRTDGALMLEQLERADVFLVPLDSQRSWFRYHHLFADVLRARLQVQAPGEVANLHRRASAWFTSTDDAPAAVRHALASGDHALAGRLVEEALPQLRRTRQDSLMLSWVRALPTAVVGRSPVLSIMAGWSAMLAGDLLGLGSRLDDAEAALAAGALDATAAGEWAQTDDLRTAPATIAVYRAALAQAHGDTVGTRRQAQIALDLARPTDHLVLGAGLGFLGLAAWAAGEVGTALATFTEAVHHLHDAGNLVDELDATIVLADLHVAAGHPGRARRACEQGLQTATAEGGSHGRAAADLHVALAELDLGAGANALAASHLETAATLAEHAFITENQHRRFVATALLRAADGDHDAASMMLDHADHAYRPGFYPEVRPLAAVRARLRITAGDLAPASAWAEVSGIRADHDADFLHEYEHLTLIRILLARNDPHSLRSASELLARLHVAATSAGRDGSVTEIQVLQALAHRADGDHASALAALGRALLESPEPGGNVRVYLDEGAPMVDLLGAAAREPLLRGAALRVLAAGVEDHRTAARNRGAHTAGRGPLVDPLSRRELEVLRLLASDLTGPEIARELYVTVNTLRTHTKRVFTKLGVHSRSSAVRAARDQGLL